MKLKRDLRVRARAIMPSVSAAHAGDPSRDQARWLRRGLLQGIWYSLGCSQR